MKQSILIVLCLSFTALTQCSPSNHEDPTQRLVESRPISEKLKGVTLEALQLSPGLSEEDKKKYNDELTRITDALRHHSDSSPNNIQNWVTARIVFDLADDGGYLNAANYMEAATRIHDTARSFVMGEILDSQAMKKCDVGCYKQRTQNYLDVLGNKVDIWEVGNEVNGEWTGKISDVIKKIAAASELVKRRGGKTALTLYYNAPCVPSDHPENEMFRWIRENRKQLSNMKLDYVLISYYEDNCNGVQPDWAAVFNDLIRYFPNSKIGIGECGMIENDEDGGCVSGQETEKAKRIDNYYNVIHHKLISSPKIKEQYIGGYFWWCYRNDMVPSTNQSWRDLNNALATW
jgi:hypothetical protein